MALMQLHINSQVMGMGMDVWALMPEIMPKDGSKLKTFWFIHGGNGDHTRWVRSSNIEKDASWRDIAVILPGCHNSSFTNMHRWHRYNEYVGGELPGIIRNIFPALSHDREDNWVSGFSNGGYGSFYVALTHPEVFGWACPAGAGDKAQVDWTKNPREKAIVYGADTDMMNSEYSLQVQAKKLIAEGRPLPKLFHACGENDPWVDMNRWVRDFFQSFEGNPFHYSYLEIPVEGHSGRAMEIAYTAFFDRLGLVARDPRHR